MDQGEAGSSDGETLVFSQRGKLKDFAWLSLRNGLLNLITLTLYRFWGKTEVRRRLWATTYLNDEAFEYTGRGVELFVGFLLALGVIVGPMLLILFGVQFLGPAFIVILPLYYLFLGFLIGFGRFTAFRYLLSRTQWRGIRFSLSGSASEYALVAFGYSLLSGMTLGWFWPAAERRLAGALWHGVRFGDQRLVFRIEDARKSKVYGAYAVGWVTVAIGYIVFFAAIIGLAVAATGEDPMSQAQQMLVIYPAALVMGIVYLAAFTPFHAAMLRSVAAGIGIGDVRFRIRLGWRELLSLTLTNVLFLLVSLGFLLPFVEARTRKFLINRVETTGTFPLESVRQNPAPAPKAGEGLADAFGISTV